MELYTNDLLLKTVTDEDINEVARMWEFEKVLFQIRENGDPKFFIDKDIYEKMKAMRL